MVGKNTLVSLVLAAAIGLNGCVTLPKANQVELTSHFNSIKSSVYDPLDYGKFLNENEYIIPDLVFDAYFKTINNDPEVHAPIGGYLRENHLYNNATKKEFIHRLEKLKLSDDEIAIYSTLFTSLDVIIFKSSVLARYGSFEKVIPHERFHRKINKLSKKDYGHMLDVAEELLEKRDINDLRFVREKDESKYGKECLVKIALGNPEEFYTYLAQGEFIPEIEEALKNDYPKVYEIFDRIKEECKLR